MTHFAAMETEYPMLRASLRHEYAEASEDVIETIVAQVYGPGVSAADAEEFLGGIGQAFSSFGQGVANVARQAVPVIGNALPGVLSGAATGAALGPWGALAGAAIGGVSSAIGAANAPRAGGRAPPRHGGGVSGTVGQIAGAAAPALQQLGGAAGAFGRIAGMAAPAFGAFARGDTGGGIGQLIGGASQALGSAVPGGLGGQIAGMLSRPEVQQAITSQLLGPYGRNQVSVGGMPVPTSAVMNMLGSLFSQAATAPTGRAGEDEALPAYLVDEAGEYVVDPADPDARAAWLAHLIASTPRTDTAMPRRAPAEIWDDGEADVFDAFDDRVDVGYSLSDLDEYDDGAEATWDVMFHADR